MADRLERYRAKRDFKATPEPSGEADAPEAGLRFVVQEHSARSMHWDLRLEHAGTLASWAIPRGIPPDPQRNNLAVRTEDHPLEYLDFAGEIPRGEYGAGTMRIYDRGTYDLHKFRDAEVMVTFHGERVRGRYVLFRTDGANWMIHRMDPPEDPDREPLPERDRADAREVRRASARRRLGVRDQVGRRAGDRLRVRRPAAAGQPAGEQHHRPLPGAARAGAGARRPRGRARRRGDRVRRGRPAELPAPAAAHAPDLRGAGAPALAVRSGRLRDLRPAVPRRPLDLRADLRAAAQAAARARPEGPRLADARPPRGRRRGAARRLQGPGPGGDRGQAAGLHVRARPPLQRLDQGQERPPRRRRRRRLGARARAGAPGSSARWPSAGTRTGSCTTAAGSAAASPRPS